MRRRDWCKRAQSSSSVRPTSPAALRTSAAPDCFPPSIAAFRSAHAQASARTAHLHSFSPPCVSSRSTCRGGRKGGRGARASSNRSRRSSSRARAPLRTCSATLRITSRIRGGVGRSIEARRTSSIAWAGRGVRLRGPRGRGSSIRGAWCAVLVRRRRG